MSLKVKLISLITTFVLLCSLLTVGVFAVKNTTFNVGGDIVFNVQGIEATITRGDTAGFTADKTIGNAEGNILSDITLNNNMTAQDVADEFAPWSGLNLAFSENVATIKLTITNTAEEGADNYLDISAIASATTKNNAKINVVNDDGEITALLGPQESVSFTITFSVIDDEYSASLNGFLIKFDMKKKVKEEFPVLSQEMTYKTFKFRTIDGENGLSIEDLGLEQSIAEKQNLMQTTGNVKIPKYVIYESKIYPVISIASKGFQQSQILTILLPDTLKIIDDYAFSYCQNLTNITLSNSLENIGYGAFNETKITQINILSPFNIKVETFAFRNCTMLEQVSFSSPTILGDQVFDSCSLLKSVEFLSTTEIGANSFVDCVTLKYIIFSNLATIGKYAFDNCTSIESLNLSYVTQIGNYAFNNCINLSEVYLSDSLLIAGGFIFNNCENLKYNVCDNIKYIGTKNNPYYYACSIINTDETDFFINSSCKILGMNVFYQNPTVKNVVLPNGMKSISFFSFDRCSALEEVNLPSNLIFLGDTAFQQCESLNCEIIIPQGITQIYKYTFAFCTNLREIIIPSSVELIEDNAFANCNNLEIIKFLGSQEQWNTLLENIGSNNDSLINATLVPNYTG